VERPGWARPLDRPAIRRAAVVAGILVALELLMFWGYFSGQVAPAPDDFIGAYNNEPFAWWRDLSRWSIPEWVPYVWGGYPTSASLQSGSWYLPLGAWFVLAPYTLQSAAVLQALHVAFGALGAYTLTRRWSLHHHASLFALVAYFFAMGFYSNALHPDIVRGFAWAPWLMFALSPAFPWRRWWGIPIAAIIFWQTVAGTYPGVTAALAYASLVWVVVSQLGARHRFRDYLGPLLVAGTVGALLIGPKYLPALLLRGVDSPTGFDGSEFTGSLVGTLFYPYDLPWLPNDLSMRSFFLVAPCIALVAISWRRRQVHLRAAVALALCAVMLGLPLLPWYDILANLPGLSLSRFRMSDFRAPFVVGAVLVASLALSAELTDAPRRRLPKLLARHEAATWATLGSVPLVALVAAVRWDYPVEQWAAPWMIVAASAAVVGRLCWRSPDGARTRPKDLSAAGAVAMVALAAVSGVTWAYGTTPPWRADLRAVELTTWGTTSDDLVDDFQVREGLTQRPARTPLDDAKGVPMDVVWNTAFYTGIDAVGGYINLRGAPSWDAEYATVLADETYFASRAFLAAPGIGMAVPDATSLPHAEDVASCATEGECGPGLSVLPDGYRPGHVDYEIDAARGTLVLFNEAFYPGWSATLCPSDGGPCTNAEPSQASSGLVLVEIPAGSWDVSLDYTTPGLRLAYAGFGVGLAAMVASALVVGRGANRQRDVRRLRVKTPQRLFRRRSSAPPS